MLRTLGQSGVTSSEDLIDRLRLDDADACGYCLLHIDDLVDIANEDTGPEGQERAKAQTQGAKNGR